MIPTPSLRSSSQHSFAQIQPPQLQRSKFRRNWTRKTTLDGGWLVPVYVEEVLPGDTINMNVGLVARLSTLLYPIMDNLHLDTFAFFAPNRILWDNWQRFNGERATPEQSIDIQIPILGGDPVSFTAFSLGDYFGLPVGVSMPVGDEITGPGINALPFRMYNLIWNEWFRAQSTQGIAYQTKTDGPDAQNNYVILNRGKRHDYFSSCLPWPQKGDAVALPLGDLAPVIGDGTSLTFRADEPTYGYAIVNNTTGVEGMMRLFTSSGNVGAAPTGVPMNANEYINFPINPGDSRAWADLSSATAANINDLREAIAIQHLLELDARGGTRYVEQLLSMWGVTVPDYRLQRPEYLGGSTDRFGIHAVAQTAPDASEENPTPQGKLSAFGQMQANMGFSYSAVEHGYLMILVNVRADITYQQGIHKMWQRSTRYDFYQPPLAHLGEQAVLNREIYYQNTSADQDVFGYQERWAEYRYSVDQVTGAFRSNYAQSLHAWHLALDFDSLPELTPALPGDAFVIDNPPISRVTAGTVLEGQQVLLDVAANASWVRCMPVYSTPGLERI